MRLTTQDHVSHHPAGACSVSRACSQVASQTLQAILPAWTAAGKSLQQLVEAVVAALPRMSPYRRLPLLSGLVSALPEVEGLCSVLALLLDTAVAQQAAAAAGDAQMADADAAAAGAEEVEPAWAADLAADLMEQVGSSTCGPGFGQPWPVSPPAGCTHCAAMPSVAPKASVAVLLLACRLAHLPACMGAANDEPT